MGHVIGFIPVRAGSKSIPGKNIRMFCGKPLIYWTVQALSQSGKFDKIVVATDGAEIKNTVLGFNFPKVEVYDRKPENASDTASTESVMLEYIDECNLQDKDVFVLVQATSPLLSDSDVTAGLELFHKTSNCVVSGTRTKRFFWNPDGQPLNYDFLHRPRRQDFPGTFMENGAFYVSRVESIRKTRCRISGSISICEMPEYTAIELDEPEDWVASEVLMKEHQSHRLNPNASKIKLFISDVDGVLTDGGMYYSESGDELKKFNTRDGMAFEILRAHGIPTALITSETTKLAERRALKMRIDHYIPGAKNIGKLKAAQSICEKLGITLQEVAYVGDDINCKELLSSVGFPACPSDSVIEVKLIPGIHILNAKGGAGAVREFVEHLFSKNYFDKRAS